MTSKIDEGLDFEVDFNPDMEKMGYELSGVIEFYEDPDTGLGAYRSLLFNTTLEESLEGDEEYTDSQKLLLIAQTMLDEYLNSEKQ